MIVIMDNLEMCRLTVLNPLKNINMPIMLNGVEIRNDLKAIFNYLNPQYPSKKIHTNKKTG